MDFLRALEAARTPFGETVWSFITCFGEETVIIAAMCFLYWCINKALAYRVGVAFFISGLLTQGLKITLRIDRPWVLDPAFTPVKSALTTATGYSFPSGHTAGAAGMFLPMGFGVNKWWVKAICFIMPFCVAFSRMYLGVHTPLDVGVALGMTAAVAVAVHFLFRGELSHRANIVISACMLAFSAALAIYSFSLASGGIIEERYLTDCVKAAAAGVGFAVGFYIEHEYIKFDTRTTNWYFQLIKYAAGMAGVLALKEGLKLLLGTVIWAQALRYFVMILWVIALYPLIFKTVSARVSKGKQA